MSKYVRSDAIKRNSMSRYVCGDAIKRNEKGLDIFVVMQSKELSRRVSSNDDKQAQNPNPKRSDVYTK